MSDSYSYDADVTDPNELCPIDRMIRDLVEYRLHNCSIPELQAMAASHMTRDLQERSLSEVQQIHDTLFITDKEIH